MGKTDINTHANIGNYASGLQSICEKQIEACTEMSDALKQLIQAEKKMIEAFPGIEEIELTLYRKDG